MATTKRKISTTTRRKTTAGKGGRKDRKNLIIGVLAAIIAVMTTAYAAFATTLTINGSATVSGVWDVEIISITSNFTGTASDRTAPSYTATTATFDANLKAPGDKATYTITVKNKGSISAVLKSITLTPDDTNGSSAIIYAVESKPSVDDILDMNDTTTIVVSATYDADTTVVPENKTKTFTGTLLYEQATPAV